MKRRVAVLLFWAALAFPVPVLTGAGPGDTKAQAEILTYESPVFTGNGEAYRPESEMEQDGKRYRLVSSELQKAVQTGRTRFVSSWISFGLEGNGEPPEMAEILVTDDDTGIQKEYTVPMLEQKETGQEWTDDFSFPVTVSGYGSDSFLLGDAEIPGDAPLKQYGPELLRYLKLPEDCYEVKEVEWLGEPYEKDEILCRDALASGRKRMRKMEVRYGGTVELPPVEGMKYYCVYREIVESEEQESTETIDRQNEDPESQIETRSEREEENREEPRTLAGRVLKWLIEHLTVVRIGAVFAVGIGLAVLLLALSGRKKKRGGQ